MNALKSFFSKDNATAKLSGYLILAASVISFVANNLKLPSAVNIVLLILAGAFTVIGQFFQSNPVIKQSSWFLLAYAVVNYLALNEFAFPNAKEILITLAGVIKLITPFSTQEPADAKPPTADPLSK